jgi:hypothetical protein
MVSYFDHAFRLRVAHPNEPVLMYAIGALFRLRRPASGVQRTAESCVSQAILAEPGCTQKALALLSYWELNGARFDRDVTKRTIESLCALHETRSFSSDVAWALAFAIQNKLSLGKAVGEGLSRLDDDAIAILACHAHSLGLLSGFNRRAIERDLRDEDCDGDHWLLIYEGVRQGYFPRLRSTVSGNGLMGELLRAKVEFYGTKMPEYAMLLHPGGAPEWVVNAWIQGTEGRSFVPAVPEAVSSDLAKLTTGGRPTMDLVRELLGQLSEPETGASERYE